MGLRRQLLTIFLLLVVALVVTLTLLLGGVLQRMVSVHDSELGEVATIFARSATALEAGAFCDADDVLMRRVLVEAEGRYFGCGEGGLVERSSASVSREIRRDLEAAIPFTSADGQSREAQAIIWARSSSAAERFGGQLAQMVFYLLGGMFLLLVVGHFLVTRFIVNPLRQLSSAAERVSSAGGSGFALDLPRNEIGDLGDSVERMLTRLEEGRRSLEERLEELARTNEALDVAHQQVSQAERLAGVGQLAAGVAHEVGNPLSAISGMLELLDDEPLSEEGAELLSRCRDEVDRMSRIIGELLSYARPSRETASEDAVRGSVEDALALVRHHGSAREVEVALVGDDALLDTPVFHAPGRLQQVLFNVIINACEASETPGRVELRVLPTSDGLALEVQDWGEGMTESQLAQAFTPFYTTRAPGKGTGLGLPVCERLIDEMDGSIRIESERSKGTTVRIELRRREEPEEQEGRDEQEGLDEAGAQTSPGSK